MLSRYPSLRLLVLSAAAAFVMAATACTPQIKKFNVTIPANPPELASQSVALQGTTHVCPGTSIKLDWAVKGHALFSATTGQRYEPPACFSDPSVRSSGTRQIANTGTQIAGTCGDTAVFRLSATHTFRRRLGYCPGPGCPNADHEVTMSTRSESIGGRVGECRNDVLEVVNTKAGADWDDHYRVGIMSVSESLVRVLNVPGRTLIILHGGKQATFNSDVVTSDVFRGETITGTWNLRLSGCALAPPALVIKADVECTK